MSGTTETLRLCYVSGPWAYFTTREPFADQWGDDWDDAPYEHNAGTPYDPCWHRRSNIEKGEPLCACAACLKDWNNREPRWRIVQVAWEGPFEPPCEGAQNSRFSVEAINRGDVAWLRPSAWVKSKAQPIPAGATIEEFRRAVKAAGGTVYEEVGSHAV